MMTTRRAFSFSLLLLAAGAVWAPARAGTPAQPPAARIRLEPLYDETYRPQYHFTPARNFLSDPNGLVYYDGEYHLFYQYFLYPFEPPITGPTQRWAHAVSTDLIHWEKLPIAIEPHGGGNIWSGSAVVDWQNSSGLQAGNEPPLVAFYTWQKDFTQRLVYSNDRGRTWSEYAGNPVVPNLARAHDRDPKVFWHEPTKRWVMVLFARNFVFLLSDDLKQWEKVSEIRPPSGECPDMFELPVDGNPDRKKWVLLGATGEYDVGTFDGTRFTKLHGPHVTDWSGPQLKQFYATQTWSDIPDEDGRRIQIACMRDRPRMHRDMPFRNQMTIPCSLSLRTTPEGVRLFRWPVREFEQLRRETR